MRYERDSLTEAVVTIPNSVGTQTLLDGFTITNGIHGVYISNSSPTISNNVIRGNHHQGSEARGEESTFMAGVRSSGAMLSVKTSFADNTN